MNATQLLVIISIIIGLATLYLVWRKKFAENNEVVDLTHEGLVVDLDRSVKYTTERRKAEAEAAAKLAQETEQLAANQKAEAEAAKAHAEAHPLSGACRFPVGGCGKK